MDVSMGCRGSAGKQISVFLDDRPGTLAAVANLLGGRGINLHALCLAEGIDHGYVRMVVDRHADACALLHESGYLFFERDVVLLELPNTPGSLGRITERWGRLGINLEYAYCAGGPNVDRGLVVVRVDDTARALQALAEEVISDQ